VPGIEVGVVASAPAQWTLRVGGKEMTVDPGTARAVWVEAPLPR
jgi:hypothetical protein